MNNIIISETTFFPVKPSPKGLIGFSSVLFNNSLCLNSISVYLRPSGELRLVFPLKTLPNTKEINVYYPVTRECYEVIKCAIVKKYKEITTGISEV